MPSPPRLERVQQAGQLVGDLALKASGSGWGSGSDDQGAQRRKSARLPPTPGEVEPEHRLRVLFTDGRRPVPGAPEHEEVGARERPDAGGFGGPSCTKTAFPSGLWPVTVTAYFQHAGNLTRTAAALPVHMNTLLKRLDRVGTVLGDDWRSPDRALQLQVALRLLALRG